MANRTRLRDRVKELRRVPASELKPHPKNWRTHSRFQRDVLRGLLGEVGIAGAVLARELPDGSLQLIDGHLRAETAATDRLPVLVLDLNEEEAERVLLTYDPISELAGCDANQLSALLSTTERSKGSAVEELLAKLDRRAELPAIHDPEEVEIPVCYQVLVEVENEAAQRAVYEAMTEAGHRCRVLTL